MTIGIREFDFIWPERSSDKSNLGIVLWSVCGDCIEFSIISIQKFYLGYPVIRDTQLNDTPLLGRMSSEPQRCNIRYNLALIKSTKLLYGTFMAA